MSGDFRRGEIWWASLRAPRGSEPGHRHPVLVVQADSFNRSAINTALVLVVTSNIALAAAPGNVRMSRRQSKLPRESVVNVSQIVTLDRRLFVQRVGRVSQALMAEVDEGLLLVLGLPPQVGVGA